MTGTTTIYTNSRNWRIKAQKLLDLANSKLSFQSSTSPSDNSNSKKTDHDDDSEYDIERENKLRRSKLLKKSFSSNYIPNAPSLHLQDTAIAYMKAAQAFQICDLWHDASDAYSEAAKCFMEINILSSSNSSSSSSLNQAIVMYSEAASAMEKVNICRAKDIYLKIISIYCDLEKYRYAADVHLKLAKMNENDWNERKNKEFSNFEDEIAHVDSNFETNDDEHSDLDKTTPITLAIYHYQKASKLYLAAHTQSGISSSSSSSNLSDGSHGCWNMYNLCLTKAALWMGLPNIGRYIEGYDLFSTVGQNSSYKFTYSNLTRFGTTTQYFFRAGLLYLVSYVVKERSLRADSNDESSTSNSDPDENSRTKNTDNHLQMTFKTDVLRKFVSMDPLFLSSREFHFLYHLHLMIIEKKNSLAEQKTTIPKEKSKKASSKNMKHGLLLHIFADHVFYFDCVYKLDEWYIALLDQIRLFIDS